MSPGKDETRLCGYIYREREREREREIERDRDRERQRDRESGTLEKTVFGHALI